MADIGSLLQFIPSFMNLMRGMNMSSSNNTAARLSNVTNAMSNTSNPLYQQLYGQNMGLQKQALGQNLSEMAGYNRMLSSMGRTPLFSPERSGENAFRTTAMAGPQMALAAQNQTQEALRNSALGLMGQSGVYGNLLKQKYGPQANFGSNNQLATGLYGLGGLANSGQAQYSQPQAQSQQLPWLQNSGVRAPGDQGNDILSMLFGAR